MRQHFPVLIENCILNSLKSNHSFCSYTFWFVEEFVRTLNLALVCPSVRLSVTRFLRIPSLLFSETLQLVRACKRDKNVPSAFLKKITFCPFWPKTVQNWPFWPKMLKNGGFSHFYRNPFIRIC